MNAKPLPSQKYLNECLSYYPLTGLLEWKRRPCAHFIDERAWKIWNTKHAEQLAICYHKGRGQITIGNHRFKAHRIIWKLMTGDDPQNLIDHRDIDQTNNRWTNLRLADESQNRVNSLGHRRRKSPYKGVSPFRNKWQAHIQFRGVARYLGVFDNPEEAHAAYLAEAARLHGDFAPAH